MSALKISLHDLTIAYRKAKVDAFYEAGHNTTMAFSEYETDLLRNLTALQSKIDSNNSEWVKDLKFVGSYTFLLKSVKTESANKNVYQSDFVKQWANNDSAAVDFRIIGQHSVDFHIVSSLWLDVVGYNIEAKLSENSYGCRLRRPNQSWESFVNKANQHLSPDELQLGHFRNYITDYKKWQKNGLNKIQTALSEETRIIAATFDIKRFYHRIDPAFLLNDFFIGLVKNERYSPKERRLTEALVTAIKFWGEQILSNKELPIDFKINGHCGIPLGLGASKVIANLVLVGLDREIEKRVKPVYYGRYVDDFFVVLKDNKNTVNNTDDFWSYLSGRLNGLTISSDIVNNQRNFIYNIVYAQNSFIEFGREKEKLFVLEGESGEALIEKLKKDLEDNSSEWKMLPDAEDNLDELSKGIVSSSADRSDEVPSLRQTDNISLQRLKFAFQLRDYEALVGLTPRELWDEGLERFFKLSIDFVFAPENIPVYYKYYPRLICLAVRTEKFQQLLAIWDRYEVAWKLLTEKVKEKSHQSLLEECHRYANELVLEAVVVSLPLNREDFNGEEHWRALSTRLKVKQEKLWLLSEMAFFADLHTIPFRRMFLEEQRRIPNAWGRKKYDLKEIKDSCKDRVLKLSTRRAFLTEILKHDVVRYLSASDLEFVPKALFFFTRPFNMLEVTLLLPQWSTGFSINVFNAFLSLFNVPEMPANIEDDDLKGAVNLRHIYVPTLDEPNNPSFALTSLRTFKSSWDAVVCDEPNEPDLTRYERLFVLINEILRRKEPITYAVFPELSIPRKLITYVSRKLKVKSISLIAGIEYEKRSSKDLFVNDLVSNQLLYVLNTRTARRHELVAIVQEKVEAAIHEGEELWKLGKKKLVPRNDFKFMINHGGFIFSGLICNDFLNIRYREGLRGAIDALLVVEWNQDVNTYDALVQASSNDLHCFVLQVNNGVYGDTRVRAPYSESYQRDQVRIRGGEIDYFVIAKLEVAELREFQKLRPSPKVPFKPIPTGYDMSTKRK